MAVGGDGVASSTTIDLAVWYSNTSASSHATPDASLLTGIEDYHGGDVLRVGNGAGLDISGHTSIPSSSRSLKLSSVLHALNLSMSRLFVQRFASDNDVFF